MVVNSYFQVRGLCGNNDGDKQDYMASDGAFESRDVFFNSYKNPSCTKMVDLIRTSVHVISAAW